ncbi:rhamnan synthesis F family protein [Rhodanobacter ginsengisoli]|uniref:Rhamnan synthesis F family protein n=1 Tax=Rhodanobacter ginsengisoli TaxID=418646 RepID=A0ABW0QPU1_9GAMM
MDSIDNLPFSKSEPVWTHLRWNSYLSLRHKLLYVATPKVACTSLKWWFASLEGYAEALRAPNGSQETDPELVVHDTFHIVAPEVTGLLPEALVESLTADDYFRFAVVRNPFKRIFSAWQSKVLLREPLQMDTFLQQDFVNHPIGDLGDISKAFERFLEHLVASETPAFRDVHWISQVDILRPDLVSYSMLAKIEDTAALSQALSDRLGHGVEDPFAAKRSNESLIPYLPDLITPRSLQLMRSIYAADFEAFGYATGAPSGNETFSAEQCDIAIKAISMLRGRHQRFTEVRTVHKSQVSVLDRTVAEKEAEIAALSQALAEHEASASVLGAEAHTRNAQLARFDGLILDRDTKLSELGESLAERAAHQQYLEHALEEGRSEVIQLKAEKDMQAARFEGAVLERDAKLGELSELLAERVVQQQRLEHLLEQSTNEIIQLKADRDAQSVRFEGALLDRDTKLSELSESLARQALQMDDVVGDLAVKSCELAKFRRLLDESGIELRKLTVAKEMLEDMNSRMKETLVWRLASKLSLVKTPVTGQDSIETTGTKVPKGFDAAWYLEEYPDVAASGMDPYQHYVLNGKSEGRQPAARTVSRSRLKKVRVLRSGLLSAVKQAGGMRKAVEKLATVAKRDGWFVSDFDEAFYLENYPDICEAGVDPYEHFVQHGRAEGRIGRSPRLQLQKGSLPLDSNKKTVLVVSHEASRTGAPILSLNIARELQKRFNVIVLVLGDGPMIPAFCEVVPLVVGPMPVNGNVGLAGAVIAQLALSHEFEFAIVNSIESRFVLRRLMELSIPAISLIHEFAGYTRPLDAFPFAIFWSAETVFSARITHENAVAGNAELAGQPFHIMPQGRCTMLAHAVDPGADALERSRLLRILRPDGDADKGTIVIVGIGYVQYRKGVDLFLECAARVIRSEGGERCRFVWIGKGYDPVNDMAYSAYLAEQLQRSGLQRQFTFMGETAAIEQVYESADILMLSSRLDPLPNVAIDAMAHGLPVVCFANTTGVVDALVDSDLSEECVAPYLDTAAMAELVLNLARSKDLRNRVGTRLQQTVRDQFDMERYVAGLEGLAREARLRLANEVESTKVILESAVMRPDFFLRLYDKYATPDEMVRYGYVRSWGAGISRRKPFPGFHPGIYAERHGVEKPGLDPLASYVRAGLPEGPWRFEIISSEDVPGKTLGEVRVALHLHVYYPDLLGEILERLSMNVTRPDLFVSVPNEKVAAVVRKMVRKYTKQLVRIEIVPNVGRDLGPFLTTFGGAFIDQYDIVGHLHTKKSVDIADEDTGKAWSQFLMENLLGGKACMADIILGRMAADPSIGIVFPDDPNMVGWGANRPYAEQLGSKLGLDDFPENLAFPVGSMFWARTEAIRPFFDLRLDWQDYPAEPLPYDGSMLHAIERMLPLVAEKQARRIVLTNVVGVTR